MGFKRKEQFSIFLLALLIGILTSLDVFEDLSEGASIKHVLIEVSIILLCFAGALWSASQLLKNNKILNIELNKTRDDLKFWKNKSKNLILGLSTVIDEQLNLWNFTESEKDIALLLIKGLSTKEISEIRNTKEKTIRSQTTSIYRKANVNGRHELSAFFLEDLLLPKEN